MKKLVFALQVFGIIALFPIYVILEMNHGTGLPENKNYPGVTEKPEKTITRVSLNSKVQNENSIAGKILTVSKDPLRKDEIIKGVAKAEYKAY
jgi:hypothetical protein